MNLNYIVRVAYQKTHNENNNYMLICLGDTGSSKSYSSISVSMMLDKNFNENRICFRGKEFMKLVNKDLPAGSVIMFDEAGVDVSSRDWYSEKNKLIKDTVETFRRDNLICVWTTPDMKGIDSQVRGKFDGVLLMVDKGKGQYKKIVTDHIEGKNYYKYPKVDGKKLEGNVKRNQFYNMIIPDPRDIEEKLGRTGLIERYEERKERFTEKVKSDGLDFFTEDETKEYGTKKLTGLVSHNPDVFKLHEEDKVWDGEMSDNKLVKIANSIMKNQFPNIEYQKSDLEETLLFCRYNLQKAQEISSNPIEMEDKREEREKSTSFPLEYLPAIKQLREDDNSYNLREIADRLGVKFHNMYQMYRKYKPYIEGDKKDQFWEKFNEIKG